MKLKLHVRLFFNRKQRIENIIFLNFNKIYKARFHKQTKFTKLLIVKPTIFS